ncbi:MAG: hypothetical protein U0M12_03870 [Acutalibacteraceae bacterium]|nr:hypothetical protein [Acutalibacteraceae bacterium]
MLKLLNYKSKKGISLAYALVVCLFLVMVTGGIMTVTILQNNETGSDLNTRQAYISAKSGLDTMQDVISNGNIIASTDFPDASTPEKYYVLYQETENGDIKYRVFNTEADMKNFFENVANPNGYIIVGGEGTYFKMTYDPSDGKINVTALNVTGKYNNNLSMNKGDLSFDMERVSYYEFKLNTVDPSDPLTDPTDPTDTTDTTEEPTDPTGTVIVGGSGGQFLLVGQQSALNELSDNYSGYSSSMGQLLHSYSPGNNQVFYQAAVENSELVTKTYFPVVYDRMVKVTSENSRCNVYTEDQGVYYLGEYSGTENLDQFACNSGQSLGEACYVTQNSAYQQSINCALLVFEHNVVTIDRSPIVNYYGKYGKGYVYIYLPNTITFYTCSSTTQTITNSFTMQPGYYAMASGSELCKQSSWRAISDFSGASVAEAAELNLYQEICNYYIDDGEIHSGCNETQLGTIGQSCINITDRNGKFNCNWNDPGTGFSETDGYDYSRQDRSRMNIFLAPNVIVSQRGYYNWYAGRSFNFQWFRKFDLSVANDCHIRMSAPTVVLTIGPQHTFYEAARDGNGNLIYTNNQLTYTSTVGTVSNVVVGNGNATWKLYGNNGTGSCTLRVMCDFVVKYDDTKSYTIYKGEYSSVPEGLDLFSDEANTWFTETYNSSTASGSVNLTTAGVSVGNSSASSNSGLMSASISNSNAFTVNPLSRLFSGLFPVSNDVISSVPASGYFTQSDFTGASVQVERNITSLDFKSYNSTDNANEFKVNIDGFKIQRQLSDGTYYDYIVFNNAGTYKIPAAVADESIDLMAEGLLRDRATWTGSNYTCVAENSQFIILKEYY